MTIQDKKRLNKVLRKIDLYVNAFRIRDDPAAKRRMLDRLDAFTKLKEKYQNRIDREEELKADYYGKKGFPWTHDDVPTMSKDIMIVNEQRRDHNRQQEIANKVKFKRLRKVMKEAAGSVPGVSKSDLDEIISTQASNIVGEEGQLYPTSISFKERNPEVYEKERQKFQRGLDLKRRSERAEKAAEKAKQDAFLIESQRQQQVMEIQQRIMGRQRKILNNIQYPPDPRFPETPSIPFGAPLAPPPGYVDPTRSAIAAFAQNPPLAPMTGRQLIREGIARRIRDVQDELRESQNMQFARTEALDVFYPNITYDEFSNIVQDMHDNTDYLGNL